MRHGSEDAAATARNICNQRAIGCLLESPAVACDVQVEEWAFWSRIRRVSEMTDSALIVRSTLYSRRTVVPQAGKICRDPRADARAVLRRMR